jgi:hypothetical protein
MYDASLDAFLPHSFRFYLSQSYYNGYLGSYGSDGFGTKAVIYILQKIGIHIKSMHHNYDAFNLFGLSLGGYRKYFIRRNK